eukprot:GHVP01053950.1.p1 GENE.GHVP01053950.1~~GHVP01053950.1.p1  ORF type:complete len:744 (+),score=103.45 GHVP01053950.1:346-2577(+)
MFDETEEDIHKKIIIKGETTGAEMEGVSAPSNKQRSGNDLLLRFIESEHFNAHIALKYLSQYGEPGIQYFLCMKLRESSICDIEFILPQLCHLAIVQKNKMISYFLVYLGKHSCHLAACIIWLIETYLIDAKQSNNLDNTVHCLSLLYKVQNVADTEIEDDLDDMFSMSLPGKRIIPHMSANLWLLGIGALLGRPFLPSSFSPIWDMFLLGLSPESTKLKNKTDRITKIDTKARPSHHSDIKNHHTPRNLSSRVFVESLINISSKLRSLDAGKDTKQRILVAELAHLNTIIKENVCIPLFCRGNVHTKILCICENDSAILQSAERVPYLIHIEIIDTEIAGISEKKDATTQNLYFLDKKSVIKTHKTASPTLKISGYLSKVRTAAVMLAQLQKTNKELSESQIDLIKKNIMSEMRHIEKMKASSHFSDFEEMCLEDIQIDMAKVDPAEAFVSEDSQVREDRIRSSSMYKSEPGWCLLSLIVKESDIRQDHLGSQLVFETKRIFCEENHPAWVYPYTILISKNGGLVEAIKDAYSIHSIKKNAYAAGINSKGSPYSIRDHFIYTFGDETSEEFKKAQKNFLNSLVGYSIVTYIFQIKDRHNGNILLDKAGHLIHIDFGFMISNNPGYVDFESKNFKLSKEYIDLLDGPDSYLFSEFREMMYTGFVVLRKHSSRLLTLVEILAKNSSLPCFSNEKSSLLDLRNRFNMSLTHTQLKDYVDRLINLSMDNGYSRMYDAYQYYTNGIF